MRVILEVEISVEWKVYGCNLLAFCREMDLQFQPEKGMLLDLQLQGEPASGSFEVQKVRWHERTGLLVVHLKLDPHWDRISVENFDLNIWRKGDYFVTFAV
jgi:hypothetical protein